MLRLGPNQLQLLLIEDNPADANLVEESLAEAQMDCNLRLLDDGAAALEFIRRIDADPHGTGPDLILLDLNLPKVNGEEVLKRIRLSPKCRHVKIMIISSSDAPSDREQAMNLGVSEYFRKPSNLDQFMELGLRGQTAGVAFNDSRIRSVGDFALRNSHSKGCQGRSSIH